MKLHPVSRSGTESVSEQICPRVLQGRLLVNEDDSAYLLLLPQDLIFCLLIRPSLTITNCYPFVHHQNVWRVHNHLIGSVCIVPEGSRHGSSPPRCWKQFNSISALFEDVGSRCSPRLNSDNGQGLLVPIGFPREQKARWDSC